MDLKTIAIIESLKEAPLLADDMPVAPRFDRALLGDVGKNTILNFEQKLGHLYEEALEYLIDASPSLSLLGSHVQIFDEKKRTLGEMDFILFDQIKNHHIHLELAVKFYLAFKSTEGWVFPGPNASDNWQRKLSHMQGHQLTLSQKPEAKALLSERFDIETIEAQQLIYGCIFTPIDCEDPPKPEAISINSQEGRWLYKQQWAEQFSAVKDVLFIPKPLWPMELPAENIKLLERISIEDLMERANKNCTMFALEATSEKLFLVPDKWPAHSLA